jgi:hypothetical protein
MLAASFLLAAGVNVQAAWIKAYFPMKKKREKQTIS